jgi:hypothetical protein
MFSLGFSVFTKMEKINCEFCESTFGLKANLKKHMNKFHIDEVPICSVTKKQSKKAVKVNVDTVDTVATPCSGHTPSSFEPLVLLV